MQVLFDKDAHGKTVESLVESFETDVIRGLSSAEAKARLTQIGGNELREQPRPGMREIADRIAQGVGGKEQRHGSEEDASRDILVEHRPPRSIISSDC